MNNNIQRFEPNRWYGKTFDHPEWVTEARNACDEIMKIYDNGEPQDTITVGTGDQWKIYWGHFTPMIHLIPSLEEWLTRNNADIVYWTINQPNISTTEYRNLGFKCSDDHKKSMNIHADSPRSVEEMVEHDKTWDKRKHDPAPKCSLNIPLDDNDGFEALRVYKYGTSRDGSLWPKQVFTRDLDYEFKPWFNGEKHFDGHGFFNHDEVELEYEELDCANKPVLINNWQPHSWHKNNRTPNKRLLLRLGVDRKGEAKLPDDPWHLFDAD